jgi:hypothetical protein
MGMNDKSQRVEGKPKRSPTPLYCIQRYIQETPAISLRGGALLQAHVTGLLA